MGGELISRHQKILVDAGIFTRDKRGVWAYYALRPQALSALAAILAGEVAPTGRRVDICGVDVMKIADGLIQLNTIYYDGATFAAARKLALGLAWTSEPGPQMSWRSHAYQPWRCVLVVRCVRAVGHPAGRHDR